MMKAKRAPKTIDEYISACPEEARPALKKMRQAVRKAVPKAEEKISYGVAVFALDGYLVYFGGWKRHIGFYPGSRGVFQVFKKEIEPYVASKGTLKFPLDKPLPLALVGRIARFRLKENQERRKLKTKKK